MAISRGPAAAVFIHEGKGKTQISGDSSSISPTVVGLVRQLPLIIQRNTHHQSLHVALMAQGLEVVQILCVGATVQSRKRGDRQSQGITTGESNAATADIEAEYGAGGGPGFQRLGARVGVGSGGCCGCR